MVGSPIGPLSPIPYRGPYGFSKTPIGVKLDIMARVAKIEDNSKHYNYDLILYVCNNSYANSTLNDTTKADL